MRHDFPPAFYACLAAGIVGLGLTLWMIYLLLKRARSTGRLFRTHADEAGTAVVEFPFALIVLVMLVCLTAQFAFMTTAYIVVDYAAFAAVRSAIVPVHTGDDKDKEGTPSEPDLDDAKNAAALVCYSIAGNYASGSAWDVQPMVDRMRNFGLDLGFLTEWAEGIRNLARKASFLTRLIYARQYTEVKKVDGAPDGAVTLDVTHWYSLAVPYADRILQGRKEFVAGYQTKIRARATMLVEGQSEKTPPKPTEYAKPPQGGK